jgi:hypothetical protein
MYGLCELSTLQWAWMIDVCAALTAALTAAVV